MKKLFFCFLFFCRAAFAAEEITNYDSVIEVQPDASVVVTETITVMREGDQIKRGIFRSLPLDKGVRYRLISVRRDGQHEDSFTLKNRGKFVINTGSDTLLPHNGLYTFEIKYRAFNVVQPFKEYDEVYWNVTGNNWIFPIKSVSARVILPVGASVHQQAGYIGLDGSKEKVYSDAGVFKSFRPLKRREGMTVAVGFDKGYVTQSERMEESVLPIVAASLLLLVYGFVTWYMYGRDPVLQAIMPRYDAPENLSAAQAGYVYFYGWKDKLCLSAAFIQGAVNKFLKFEETPKNIKVIKLRNGINAEEKFFQKNLTMPLSLSETSNISLVKFMNNFKSFMKNQTASYFVRNGWFSVVGALLLLAFYVGLCFYYYAEELFIVLYFFPILLMFFSAARRGSGKKAFMYKIICLLQPIALFLIFWSPIRDVVRENENGPFLVGFLVAFTALLSFYFYLMHRPSEKGQRLKEHMDGLKMFMKAVHQDFPKNISFEKMEKLLPYAVLFQIEKEWVEKMEEIAGHFEPEWYQGTRSWSHSRFLSFSSLIGSASTPPMRSSGSGGGGFSGGGFGGGGGGGR